MVIVQKAVKEFISNKGMQSSGDLSSALEKEVEVLLSKAVERAKANGRKTVTVKDL